MLSNIKIDFTHALKKKKKKEVTKYGTDHKQIKIHYRS